MTRTKARMVKINEGFICSHCLAQVPPATSTCRNHCCKCLWSLHLDQEFPGDRNCECRGLMEPVYVEKTPKGLMVVHRCRTCGIKRRNRLADDDDWETVIELARFAP